MSENTLQYIDNNSIFHRADALSKLAWVLIVVIFTFQFQSAAARGIMLASLLIMAIFFARVPLTAILRASPLIFCWEYSTCSSHPEKQSFSDLAR
jgi:energy-coupling factor transporter transmembrane protein EcfT